MNQSDPSAGIGHIALIGLGSIGCRHLRILKELHPEIDVTIVRSGQGSPWPEEVLAKRVVKNSKDAIDDGAQAAIICSPASFHLDQALEWIDAEKPVLIEKPLSNSLNGLDQFAERVSKKNVPILLGYVLRYDYAAQYFKQQLLSKKFGEIISARIECGSFLPVWRPQQDYRQTVSACQELGGGVLLELSHELDYAQWFFGSFTIVQAALQYSGTLEIDVEDGVELMLQSQFGKLVSIHLDFYRKVPRRQCTVQTAEGELNWDILKQLVRWTDSSGKITEKHFTQQRDDLFRRQFLHFLDCAAGLTQPLITLGEMIHVMELIEAARESDSSGRRISL